MIIICAYPPDGEAGRRIYLPSPLLVKGEITKGSFSASAVWRMADQDDTRMTKYLKTTRSLGYARDKLQLHKLFL
jgi:hypothetical protein